MNTFRINHAGTKNYTIYEEKDGRYYSTYWNYSDKYGFHTAWGKTRIPKAEYYEKMKKFAEQQEAN